MGKKIKKRSKTPRIKKHPPGTAPGELAVPLIKDSVVRLTLMTYNENNFAEETATNLQGLKHLYDKDRIIWLNIEGLQQTKVIEEVGTQFNLHRLALEDVTNTHQRPKVEQYGDYSYIVLRVPRPSDNLESDQISLFFGPGFIITFHEGNNETLAPVQERLRHGAKIRQYGVGYLTYAIIDALIDTYFPLLEKSADTLDVIEEKILDPQDDYSVRQIHELKRELLVQRRNIWAHRELVNSLMRDPPKLIDANTAVYLRDCYDHTMQQLDLVETYRDVCSYLVDLSFSIANHKANEIMKFLTVVASIFIPLTFITGVYGMNFNTGGSPFNMPELDWYFGYPFALSLMVAIAGFMVFFFRRKGWF